MYNDSRDTMAQITALQLDTLSTLHSMATLFTRILNGELPARFVWRDDLTIVAWNSYHPGVHEALSALDG